MASISTMANKHMSPKAVTTMPLVITLDRPSASPQTFSSILPTTSSSSTSMASSSTMSTTTTTATTPHTNESNTLAPITSPMAPTPIEQHKKPLDITSLMSPPEPTLFDSFSHGPSSSNSQASSKIAANTAMLFRPQAPMSPPVSPFNKTESSASTSVASLGPPTPNSGPVKDPILYPAQDGLPNTPSPPQRPLFEPMDVDDHERINEHIASRSTEMFHQVTPPNEDEYKMVLSFKLQMMETMAKDPRRWLQRNLEQLAADKRAKAKANKARLPKLLPARTTAMAPVAMTHVVKVPRMRPDKVTKPNSSKPLPSTPRPMRASNGPPRAGRISATPEPRRAVAPNREDKKFDELPDYCPPRESLPDKPNSLKVDWKGAPIDLTGDPHAHLLHPDEVSLAANLRLDCATYLTSKRRIFIRRLECAERGKEFRKTDAQQACKIDVNKASKLWTAFEKVGWLKLEWMQQWLNKRPNHAM